METIIAELKSKWIPETRQQTGYGVHGSRKGDEWEYTEYFDVFRCEWTNKDRAFQGYVFKYINSFIKP